jgi:hypothetical protein
MTENHTTEDEQFCEECGTKSAHSTELDRTDLSYVS